MSKGLRVTPGELQGMVDKFERSAREMAEIAGSLKDDLRAVRDGMMRFREGVEQLAEHMARLEPPAPRT